MTGMIRIADLLRQLQIANQLRTFTGTWDTQPPFLAIDFTVMYAGSRFSIRHLFGMCHDHTIILSGRFHRLSHNFCGRNTNTIITKPANAKSFFDGLHIDNLFTGLFFGDTGVWMHMHNGILIDFFNIRLNRLYIIRVRDDIRHTENRSKATMGGRQCSGMNRFFLRIARFSQMHMHIHKSRNNG